MLKVGDRLLCKKGVTDSLSGDIYYKEKKYYEIKKVTDEKIILDSEIHGFEDTWYFFPYISFNFYIWDHFYTKIDLRKIKLEKLEECTK